MVSLIKQGGAFGRAKASISSHIFGNQGKFGRGRKHELNYKRPLRDSHQQAIKEASHHSSDKEAVGQLVLNLLLSSRW